MGCLWYCIVEAVLHTLMEYILLFGRVQLIKVKKKLVFGPVVIMVFSIEFQHIEAWYMNIIQLRSILALEAQVHPEEVLQRQEQLLPLV